MSSATAIRGWNDCFYVSGVAASVRSVSLPLSAAAACFSSPSSSSSSSSSPTSSQAKGDPSNKSTQSQHKQQHEQEFYPHRHPGIQMHPESISQTIIPGNMVWFTNSRTGLVKKRYVELAHGYFWMVKELNRIGQKPILSNATLIPEDLAKPFPTMTGLMPLQPISTYDVGSSSSSSSSILLFGQEQQFNNNNNKTKTVQLPDDLFRRNRCRDPAAQCTLVMISFRDFGYRQLSSWLEPFQQALQQPQAVHNPNKSPQQSDRIDWIRINISQGFFSKWILRSVIWAFNKRNTAKTEHTKTLLYFASDAQLEPIRDALRMHNILMGYVFLLDGLGRVRFAGSGPASEQEAQHLIQLAQELVVVRSSSSSLSKTTTTTKVGRDKSSFSSKKPMK